MKKMCVTVKWNHSFTESKLGPRNMVFGLTGPDSMEKCWGKVLTLPLMCLNTHLVPFRPVGGLNSKGKYKKYTFYEIQKCSLKIWKIQEVGCTVTILESRGFCWCRALWASGCVTLCNIASTGTNFQLFSAIFGLFLDYPGPKLGTPPIPKLVQIGQLGCPVPRSSLDPLWSSHLGAPCAPNHSNSHFQPYLGCFWAPWVQNWWHPQSQNWSKLAS